MQGITGSQVTEGMIITFPSEGSTAYRVGAVEVNSQCVYAMLTAYGDTAERRIWNETPVTQWDES
jgi:hypothetical protein